MNHKELHEGIGGNGSTVWLVVTVNENGQWVWTERFDNELEAKAWVKYA